MRTLRQFPLVGSWPALLAGALLAGALLVSACSPELQFGPGKPAYKLDVSLRDDAFHPETEYASSIIREGTFLEPIQYQLVAKRDRRTLAVRVAVHCGITYSGFGYRHYAVARDAHAQQLVITDILKRSRHCGKGPCEHAEYFNVYVPEADIRAAAAAKATYAIKLFAKTGSERLVVVPADVVVNVLTRLDNRVMAGAPGSWAAQSKPAQ